MLFPNLHLLKLYCEGEGGKEDSQPWLVVELSWCVLLYTQRLRVCFQARAHAWAMGSMPSQLVCVRQLTDVSFSLPLSKNVKRFLNKCLAPQNCWISLSKDRAKCKCCKGDWSSQSLRSTDKILQTSFSRPGPPEHQSHNHLDRAPQTYEVRISVSGLEPAVIQNPPEPEFHSVRLKIKL